MMPSAMPLQDRIAKILTALSMCCWHTEFIAKANGQEETEGICSQEFGGLFFVFFFFKYTFILFLVRVLV